MRNKAWGAKIANETLGKGYVKVPLGNGKAGKGGGTGGGANTRAWFVIGSDGTCETMEAGKHAIMKRTGLPGRDLRMLEPSLSYPSTILGREKAIVFNVEHIKAIITCTEILLLNSRDPVVSPFAHALVRRLSLSPAHSPFQKNVHDEANMGATNKTNKGSYLETNEMPESTFCRDVMKKDTNGLDNGTSPKVLPFEFRALEACLEASCSSLDVETTTLEKEAYPALDELTTSTSTLNLERVRQIKSRLVAISGRVQKVRDELEHLLDDDGDMAEMYLTNKFLEQQLGDGSFWSFDGAKLEFQNSQHEVVDERDLDGVGEDNDINTNTSSSDQSSHGDESSSKHFDVEELEMLLEAYFVQIDGTLNKLSALREYVDDTEDYINIMLDDKQNQLLQMGVVLSTSNLLFNCAIVVVGLFGMNINIELFDEKHAGLAQFSWTVAGAILGGVVLYIFAMSWWRKKGLLE